MASEAWPERIAILTGTAWAFGLHVSADLVLPPAHRSAAEPARHLLTGIDPEFPSRVRPGDFVVAGNDFAAGTADDAGVRALVGAGIGAVIAYSLDPEFAARALAHALPAVCIHEALAIHTGARLRVDLEEARVVNLSSGDRYPIRNLDDAVLDRLRARHARG
jgi:3-isopropylmalate/(R)-2-methylmalate dehydratase small subunit